MVPLEAFFTRFCLKAKILFSPYGDNAILTNQSKCNLLHWHISSQWAQTHFGIQPNGTKIGPTRSKMHPSTLRVVTNPRICDWFAQLLCCDDSLIFLQSNIARYAAWWWHTSFDDRSNKDLPERVLKISIQFVFVNLREICEVLGFLRDPELMRLNDGGDDGDEPWEWTVVVVVVDDLNPISMGV